VSTTAPGAGWSPGGGLLAVLARSQGRGAIGPAPLVDHVDHALGFLEACPELGEATAILDLGSGGGLPGLVLAARLPETRICLLDGRVERARLLGAMIGELGWSDRVTVVAERAEIAAHEPELRGSFPAVVARSFGHPAATAECGAGFLVAGGVLVVSGPPGGEPASWPAVALGELGLQLVRLTTSPRSFVVLRLISPCPARFPRRIGFPERRPLF
jgi:16S rRNA (guanine527-N7)-methyltransferase